MEIIQTLPSNYKPYKEALGSFPSTSRSCKLGAFISLSEIFNSLNCIPLDDYKFSQSDLPIFYIDSMAAIPFGLGVSKGGKMLSLEHTHPPASLVLFGQRNSVQGRIKQKWVSKFGAINGS